MYWGANPTHESINEKIRYSVIQNFMKDTKATLFEQILLEKLAEGDHSAFSTVFKAYYKDLVQFAFTFTKDADNAEEAVQEVFVRLWEKRS